MEFSVKKFDLLQELELTQGVVERKQRFPSSRTSYVRPRATVSPSLQRILSSASARRARQRLRKKAPVPSQQRNYMTWFACCLTKRSNSSCSRTIGFKSRATEKPTN